MNQNISPYYNDFDASKKFSQILFVPGRGGQAREFTQLQSILLNALKNISSAILNEGSIVSGMDITLKGNVITIQSGRVYLGGLVHDFEGQDLYISSIGEEKIGVKLVESIITESDDVSLRDPAQSAKGYGQPGAHRLKSVVHLTLNDSTVPTIYTLVDGNLQVETQKPQLDLITDLLAKRMFDESGNYLVEGMSMYTKEREGDDDNFTLTVNAGRAYVQGYEVNRPSPAYLTIAKSRDYRTVIGELKVFRTGTNQYKLNNLNVKDITQVIATLQATEQVTRGAIANGMDLLSNTPVLTVVSVKQSTTTYQAGTDFQLTGDSIDWSLGGAEPSIGSSYTVVYNYNKELVLNTDYKLTLSDDGVSYLDFNVSGGSKPVDSSNLTISYEYYLAKAYRIYLNKDGVVSAVPGQSDTIALVQPPVDKDDTMLSLGTITCYPNSGKDITVKSESISRYSMKDLSNLVTRVDNLEYNSALNDLDNEAMSGESPTNLKGILTDGFLGFTKADIGHSEYNAAIDIQENEAVLPSDYINLATSIDSANSSIKSAKNFITGSYSEETIVSQGLTTGAINVNPYRVFTGATRLVLSPSVDNWIDMSTVQIDGGTQVQTKYVKKWWQVGTERSTQTSTVVVDSVIPYARQIKLTIKGTGFPSYENNLRGTIDGTPVNLAPVSGTTTTVGTQPGTVRAGSDGSVNATFTIPSGIRSGSTQVLLTNDSFSASAVFTATGISRVTRVTNTTIEVISKRSDPVAQTFQLSVDRMVTSVKLWFATKDNSIPVTVQLRNVVNGYPGINVLASQTLQANQIRVSEKGRDNETTFVFDNPVLCNADEQYCFVVLTTSDQYQLHKATLAGKELSTGKIVNAQPYTDGVLFLSSNGITWSAEQESDLKFDLQAAVFSGSKQIQFNAVNNTDIDGLIAMVDFDLPTNTSIKWQYKLGDGSWMPFVANKLYDTEVATKLTVRGIMECTRNLSPIILSDSCNLIGIKTSKTGVYVGRLVTTSQTYTKVKVVLEAYMPTGTTVVPQISTDNSTWVSPTLSSSEMASDGVYTRLTYTYTIPSSGTSTKYRCRVNLTSPNRVAKPKVRKLLNILT